VLVALVLSRKHLVGDLFRTVKKLPKDFDEGQRAVDDPASQAKPVTPLKPPRDE
jgi:hypothetical protein